MQLPTAELPGAGIYKKYNILHFNVRETLKETCERCEKGGGEKNLLKKTPNFLKSGFSLNNNSH